ncbi:hypothetical protein ACP4OV_013816 [Aristida adscensionis]
MPRRAVAKLERRAPSSLDLHLRSGVDDPDRLLGSLHRRGRRRLDRFSLTFHFGEYRLPRRLPRRYFRDEDIRRCLDYAAACDAEDLRLDIADHFLSTGSTLPFAQACPRRARLSLLRVGNVTFGYDLRSDAYAALEVVQIHYARSDLCVGSFRISYLFDQAEEFAELKRAAAADVRNEKLQSRSYLYVPPDLPVSEAGEALCALPSSSSDTSVGNSLEVAEDDESEERHSEEDVTEDDEPDEELSEEEDTQSDEPEEELSEEDVTGDELLQEELVQ